MWTAVLGASATCLSGCFDSPPQIISLTPSRGSIGVPADTPIAVQFDRPVVRSSVAGRFTVDPQIQRCDLAAAFTAAADAACSIVWSGGDAQFTLVHPRAVLDPDTQYSFTLRGGFRDPTGAVNTVDHTWTLTTAGAPDVRATTPSDGATGVPIDGPLTVDFNAGMDLASTRQAISLDPAVPGTQVVRNVKDKSRFMLVPGSLLQPHVTYRLSVARSATDLHGQRIRVPTTIAFTTASLSPGSHGVVLARQPGDGPTQVLITALEPVEDGMPVTAQAALTAPVCGQPAGCGDAAQGSPLYTYSAATMSSDNRWLAVEEQDRTRAGAPPALLVLDAASRAFRAALAAATMPSWSTDGSTLAYASGSTVHLYHPATGRDSSLPPGDPLVAPPTWGPSGELLALDEQAATGEHVVLADAVAGVRFPVPGVTGETTSPSLAPDGQTLAIYRLGRSTAGAWVVGLGAGAPAPRQVGAGVIPVGFADRVTLVVRSAPASGPLALNRVSLTGGDSIGIPLAVGGVLPTTPIAIAPAGRQIAYLAAPDGITNAYVVNADGSGAEALTSYGPDSFEVAGITLS
ncbi:MAG: Ig-like domain-containing protein [Candidatus Dormibacteraeota bacterium]|nr:Ig-like domain-containing protein [Candidatus Dormibacteraeota bacterium]